MPHLFSFHNDSLRKTFFSSFCRWGNGVSEAKCHRKVKDGARFGTYVWLMLSCMLQSSRLFFLHSLPPATWHLHHLHSHIPFSLSPAVFNGPPIPVIVSHIPSPIEQVSEEETQRTPGWDLVPTLFLITYKTVRSWGYEEGGNQMSCPL